MHKTSFQFLWTYKRSLAYFFTYVPVYYIIYGVENIKIPMRLLKIITVTS